MKSDYSYEILLDINQDAWNWEDSINQSTDFNYNWKDNLEYKSDIKIYSNAKKLDHSKALKYLNKALSKKYIDESKKIDDYKNIIELKFNEKFLVACKTIENITQKKLAIKKYHLLLTTFPRCPYNFKDGTIFFYITFNKYWPDPIDNFMHEVMHFQTHIYYEHNPNSLVSKLNENQFNDLKEALTVILNKNQFPILTKSDQGYQAHQTLRKILYWKWQKNNDFNEVIEHGAKLMLNNQIS